jgi:hypothetical protein
MMMLKNYDPDKVLMVESSGTINYCYVTHQDGRRTLESRGVGFLAKYWPKLKRVNRSLAVSESFVKEKEFGLLTLQNGEKHKIGESFLRLWHV